FLTRRADVVPDVDRHDRHGVILVEDHVQAIRQRELRVAHFSFAAACAPTCTPSASATMTNLRVMPPPPAPPPSPASPNPPTPRPRDPATPRPRDPATPRPRDPANDIVYQSCFRPGFLVICARIVSRRPPLGRGRRARTSSTSR